MMEMWSLVLLSLLVGSGMGSQESIWSTLWGPNPHRKCIQQAAARLDPSSPPTFCAPLVNRTVEVVVPFVLLETYCSHWVKQKHYSTSYWYVDTPDEKGEYQDNGDSCCTFIPDDNGTALDAMNTMENLRDTMAHEDRPQPGWLDWLFSGSWSQVLVKMLGPLATVVVNLTVCLTCSCCIVPLGKELITNMMVSQIHTYMTLRKFENDEDLQPQQNSDIDSDEDYFPGHPNTPKRQVLRT